jgi:AbrB family looped-hinge helix DNA binding protein
MTNIINIAKTTVSSKGQIVIPSALRDFLGIHEGSELTIKIRDDGVCELEPTKRDIEMFFGRCKSKKATRAESFSVEDMDNLILKVAKLNDRH